MDAKQELDAMLKIPDCHALLVNALEDYLGRLKEISETGVSSGEAAYYPPRRLAQRHLLSVAVNFFFGILSANMAS